MEREYKALKERVHKLVFIDSCSQTHLPEQPASPRRALMMHHLSPARSRAPCRRLLFGVRRPPDPQSSERPRSPQSQTAIQLHDTDGAPSASTTTGRCLAFAPAGMENASQTWAAPSTDFSCGSVAGLLKPRCGQVENRRSHAGRSPDATERLDQAPAQIWRLAS
jgi:hypothetical protein